MKVLAIFVIAVFSFAEINKYLEAVKKTSDSKIDELMIKEMKVSKNSVVSSLYPKVSIFSSIEHFSSPTSLRPLPPTEVNEIAKQGGGYPFSQNIEKIGFSVSMPLFIKSIYDNKKRMEYLLRASKYQSQINILKREALLIVEISNYNYLLDLKEALLQKKSSIIKTINAIKVGVEVGRIPEFKLIRLKDALLSIELKIKSIENAINKSKSKIYQLTKLQVDKKINFKSFMPQKKEFLSLKPIKEKIIASKYLIKSSEDKFLPKFSLVTNGYRAFAKAYDNDKDLALNFASIGIYMEWSVFDRKNSSEIQKSKLEYMKNRLLFQKTLKDLEANEKELLNNIKNLENAIKLAKKSLKLKEDLLKKAKVAFELNEMNVDEYLGYEDELADVKAKLSEFIALKNSMIANLAFIYGSNYKRIFK